MITKKRPEQMNIGSATMVLLLMVFALTVFALLSMRASYQELKRSEKVRSSIEEYYKADAKSEEGLLLVTQAINQVLKKKEEDNTISFMTELKKEISQYEGFSFEEEAQILTFIVALDYNKQIETKLLIQDDFTGYDILSHKMLILGQEDYEQEELELWDGKISE